MGAFGEDQHIHAAIDQPEGDKPYLPIIKSISLALKRCIPIEPFRSLQGNSVFGDVRRILGWIELDIHGNFVHPLIEARKTFYAPTGCALPPYFPFCPQSFRGTNGAT
jgi:hypothetical protein